MINKLKAILLAVLLAAGWKASAGEGMWLPLLLQQLNEKEMRDMGLRITADDIYSVNHSSLKDAVVLFGGGCTAEVVSDQGLLLTNHHCGLGNIQKHSTLEHDYITNGFWAQSLAEELPNPGLSVTFLVRMEDVSRKVLAGVNAKMSQAGRDSITAANIKAIVKEASTDKLYNASVKPFYAGNQYYLFVTETFTDVRLVGAPPSSIGKFGGDTDNWMWPRHTGDFSVFRIYADKNNKPAAYSKDNVPYKPAKHFTISLKGVSEGDFTFVYGFPGTTREYLSSYAVDMQANQRNPIAVGLRGKRLEIVDKAMAADPLTRIQYFSKAAGISNSWKQMIGETRGIKKLNGLDKKQEFEAQFQAWADRPEQAGEGYSQLLPAFRQAYAENLPLVKANTYINEGLMGVELLRFANSYAGLVKACRDASKTEDDISKLVAQLKTSAGSFFSNYNVGVDRQLFAAMMGEYTSGCDQALQADAIKQNSARYKGDYQKWTEALYSRSAFADSNKVKALLNSFSKAKVKMIEKDPAFVLAQGIYTYQQNRIVPGLTAFYKKTDSLQQRYMAAQMLMQPEKRFYPDANSTLRVAYGNVKGYYPADAVKYTWFTTLDGIMQKENPDIADYAVDSKLKQLYLHKDYGRYAGSDSRMHVAFIAANHTTGGNSGSPVLNGDGELVGINFDRCWEGTMSDLMYDPDQCRNISLDIRYCLFIIDKLAGAQRLINEMSIVQ